MSSANSAYAQESIQTGTIKLPELTESSGLAASASFPGLWWSHNDGKHKTELFLISEDGKEQGHIELRGALNRDWEDISRFDWQGKSFLLLGDIGDNLGNRSSITLYVFTEPQKQRGSVIVEFSLKLTYPDGPRDSEAIAVDTHEGFIYLLSKRDHPARLYRLPLKTVFSANEAVLDFVGEVDSIPPHTDADIALDPERGRWSDQATAMDISADGSMIALQTYKMALIYTRQPKQTWLDALNGKPKMVNTHPLTQEEAIGFSLDDNYLLLTTEVLPAPILKISLH